MREGEESCGGTEEVGGDAVGERCWGEEGEQRLVSRVCGRHRAL